MNNYQVTINFKDGNWKIYLVEAVSQIVANQKVRELNTPQNNIEGISSYQVSLHRPYLVDGSK